MKSIASSYHGCGDCNPNERFKPPLRHLYGYRLEPSDVGTLVTSYCDWSEIDEAYRGRGSFPVIPKLL